MSWKNRRATSGEGPATPAPSAAVATKTGPYTDARCRQCGLTRWKNGSWRKSAGEWSYGLASWTVTMRPYIVYDHTSFDVRGDTTTDVATTSAIAAATGAMRRRGSRCSTTTNRPASSAAVSTSSTEATE